MTVKIKQKHFPGQLSNKQLKLISSLKYKKFRDETGLFITEGFKICSELFTSDYETEFVVITGEPDKASNELAISFSNKGIPVYSLDEKNFKKVSDTVSPQSIFAVVNKKEQICDGNKSFVALDCIQDPGNLGTIIRTADWFGFTQILLTNNCADVYNPKTIRSTMGSLFHSKIMSVNDLIGFTKKYFPNHELYGSVLNSTFSLENSQPFGKFGIVFGNESQGISQYIEKNLTKTFKIKGQDNIDSLNVAVAVGISLHHFEKFI